jgi:hypothetical protein
MGRAIVMPDLSKLSDRQACQKYAMRRHDLDDLALPVNISGKA